MIMEMYRKLDHAFNKDLVGVGMDAVIEQLHKMDFKIEDIRRNASYIYLRACYYPTESNGIDSCLTLCFNASSESLKRCEINIHEY